MPFYTKGAKLEFIEDDMFSVIVPVGTGKGVEPGVESQPESGPNQG